jgi:hypothetical protein
LISRKSVFSPTPAKVSRNAQRDRLASEPIWCGPNACRQGVRPFVVGALAELTITVVTLGLVLVAAALFKL